MEEIEIECENHEIHEIEDEYVAIEEVGGNILQYFAVNIQMYMESTIPILTAYPYEDISLIVHIDNYS